MVDYIELDENGKVTKREKKGRGRPRIGYIQATEGKHVGHWIKNGQTLAEKKEEEKEIIPVKIPTVILDPDEDDSITLKNNHRDKRVFRYNSPVTDTQRIIDAMHHMGVDTKNGVTVIENPICVKDTGVAELTYNALWHRIEIDEKANEIKVWSTYLGTVYNEEGTKDKDGTRVVLSPNKIIYGALIITD